VSETIFSFDAKIGSITDFQSANDQAEVALIGTPLIKNVGVPATPKYHK
jgi:hypothetical protein